MQVGDPDAATQRLADAEASGGPGSLSARSYRSVASAQQRRHAGHRSSDGPSAHDDDDDDDDDDDEEDSDMTGQEFDIVLETDDSGEASV